MSKDGDSLQGPTIILVGINIVVFIITSLISRSITRIGVTALVLFGLSLKSLLFGLIWTPFTSIFTHSGIAHLLGNMIFLLIYGFKLEEENISWKQITLAYFVTGVSAGLLSMFFLPNSFQVGASGSVFGILGIVYGLSRRKGDPDSKKVLYAGIILLIFASGSANTNIFAHIIGFVMGVYLGKSTYFSEFGEILEDPSEFR